MDVGLQMVFASYGWTNVPDEQVWDEELRLARLAADLGFDVLWSVEHHFNDYSFCPDNLQLMSYLAAECVSPSRSRSSTTSAEAGCGWAWAADWPGGSSRPFAARWTNRGGGSTRPRR